MSGPAEPTDVLGASELVRFASELADSPERWRNLVRLEPSVRVYETLWSDDYVNAWVICWPDDADTGFHDHHTSAAVSQVDRSTFSLSNRFAPCILDRDRQTARDLKCRRQHDRAGARVRRVALQDLVILLEQHIFSDVRGKRGHESNE